MADSPGVASGENISGVGGVRQPFFQRGVTDDRPVHDHRRRRAPVRDRGSPRPTSTTSGPASTPPELARPAGGRRLERVSPPPRFVGWQITGGPASTGGRRKHGSTGIPQFRTEIDGQRIHFVHVRSDRARRHPARHHPRLPQLVCRVHRARSNALPIPARTAATPRSSRSTSSSRRCPAGFSTPLAETGWNLSRTAKATAELMRRLGYERYGAHGATSAPGSAES